MNIKNHFFISVFLGCSVFFVGAIHAKTPPKKFNPGQVEPFCPPGMDLVDLKNNYNISPQEQVQIQKNVKEFMRLDANGERVNYKTGGDKYWLRGVSPKYEIYDENPTDSLRYFDWRYKNICYGNKKAVAIILIDVSYFGRTASPIKNDKSKRSLSAQQYWDAASKKALVLEKSPDPFAPPQPLIYLGINLINNEKWLIDQKTTPQLLKVNKEKELKINAGWLKGCDVEKMTPVCVNSMANRDFIIENMSRPPWTKISSEFGANK